MQLQIDNLSKRYPNGTQALQDVSLSIPQGMFGLLGPNGAGKSTLMRTLATLQEADSGTATLDGIDVLRQKGRSAPAARLSAAGVRPVSQSHGRDLLAHFARSRESRTPRSGATSSTRCCARPTCGTIATSRWAAFPAA